MNAKKYTLYSAIRCISIWICLSLITIESNGQYNIPENNNWLLGRNTGYNFEKDSVISSVNISGEVAASVSDTAGNLLFYTDGTYVWNRNNTIMSGGMVNALQYGSSQTTSTTQGALIVPVIDSPGKYYVFGLTCDPYPSRLRYAIVDMALDGGLGNLTLDTTILDIDLAEKMIAIPSCDGVWLITQQKDVNALKAYKIDASGIHVPVNSFNKSVTYSPGIIGQLAVSTDFRQIAAAYNNLEGGSRGAYIELYDFNDQTGRITSRGVIDSTFTDVYGVCFSPENSRLYATNWEGRIVQYDLTQSSMQLVAASRTEVFYGIESPTQLQLGPDGRIYFRRMKPTGTGSSTSNYLGVIHYPNLLGTACSINDTFQLLYATGPSCLSVQNLYMKPLNTGYFTTTIFDTVCSYTLDTQTWTESGNYTVVFKNVMGCDSTINVHLTVPDITPIISVDRFRLGTTIPYKTYQWTLNDRFIEGATGASYVIDSNGRYRVIVSDANGCIDTSAEYIVSNVAIHKVGNDLNASEIRVAPNPINDKIIITSSFNVNVELRSIDGRMIMQQKNAKVLSVPFLSRGIYLLNISDTHGRLYKTEKIIK